MFLSRRDPPTVTLARRRPAPPFPTGAAMLDVDVRCDLRGFALAAAFTAPSRGVTALFGTSGSGKTTVVNVLAGLLRPNAGRVVLDGRVLFDAARRIHVAPERRRVGYVFQEARLFPHYSVRGNMRYGARLNPPAEDPHLRFDHVVELLGIGHLLDRRPHTLSGGERQRVAIARALLANPRLLLMDEPMASLDAGRKGEILPYLERLRDELRLPIVYVSHSVDEVTRLADTVVLLDRGRVVAADTVEALTARLDFRAMTEVAEAGAVLATRVAAHDPEFGLTRLAFAGARMQVPAVDLPVGTPVRVRVQARDVALALTPPHDVSVLNVLPATIREFGPAGGPSGAYMDVLLDAGAPLIARLTRRSVRNLGLRPGSQVYAMIKAVSLERGAP
jgi:molybdate transport system ATP-binding protein